MVKLRHRCKSCNEYTEVEVDNDNYFKWLTTNNIEDLNLGPLDKLLMMKHLCNSCRIATGGTIRG